LFFFRFLLFIAKGDFAAAAELQHSEIPLLEARLLGLETDAANADAEAEADIAAEANEATAASVAASSSVSGSDNGETNITDGGGVVTTATTNTTNTTTATTTTAAAAAGGDVSARLRRSILPPTAVDEAAVAGVVARHTGIPLSKLLVGERQRLLSMETELSKRVIGQNKAAAAVAQAIQISRAGLRAHTRPVGSFLFLGPSGVGKTELCKALATFLFDDEVRSCSHLRRFSFCSFVRFWF
jgi:ATP-dependent Clp protease ATP-binding subunit ClpB